MVVETVTYLDVPYKDKERVKQAGARWDPAARSWYAPAGADLNLFSHWLPIHVENGVPVEVLGLPTRCWSCGAVTVCVSAFRRRGETMFAGRDVLQMLASQLSSDTLQQANAGAIRPRWSKTVQGSYWSNGCLACDALQGEFPLWEDFVEIASTGGDLLHIASALLPADLVDEFGLG